MPNPVLHKYRYRSLRTIKGREGRPVSRKRIIRDLPPCVKGFFAFSAKRGAFSSQKSTFSVTNWVHWGPRWIGDFMSRGHTSLSHPLAATPFRGRPLGKTSPYHCRSNTLEPRARRIAIIAGLEPPLGCTPRRLLRVPVLAPRFRRGAKRYAVWGPVRLVTGPVPFSSHRASEDVGEF